MIAMPDLRTALMDLGQELRHTDIKPIVGGGFGIFLKLEYVHEHNVRTLFTEWPEPRSTNDIDLFLRPELLIHSEKLKPLSRALAKLGYKVVPSAAKYQFVKNFPVEKSNDGIKIDILTGSRDKFVGTSVKLDSRRVSPRPSVDIHAHLVDEVPTLEEGLIRLSVKGCLSSGAATECEVYVPHPFSFILMKLFAFNDRKMDEIKDYGRYHALDIYASLATMSESEWNASLELQKKYSANAHVKQARGFVRDLFSGKDQLGIIRFKENHYFRTTLNVAGFIDSMKELFEVRTPPSSKP
jgi:hypothetical protein